MRRFRLFLAIGVAIFATEIAHADATATVRPVAAAAGAPATELNKLLRDYREAELKLRPNEAIARGDERYLDHYDDSLTQSYLDARRQVNEETRNKLAAIDPSRLNVQDALSYDIFRWSLDDESREVKPGIAERFQLLALNQFDGAQITFPREMQWRADNPWTKPQDYDRGIRRMLEFTHYLDRAIINMREGIKEHVVQPRPITERMIAQVQIFTDGNPDANVFMAPLKNMPSSIAGAERERIQGAYREAIEGQLLPAYRRLLTFLTGEYLPRARDSFGLGGIPGGKEMYLYLVKSETTADLTPDAIHALGRSELARIETAMERIKTEAGFNGSLAQFRAFLRNDPQFRFKDSAAMLAEFNRVKAAVNGNLPKLFVTKPKANLTFRVYESYIAPDRPAAEYAPASADGRRPGIVYLNSFELPSRPTYTSEVLELHEGIPGHHLQLAVAMENRNLPRFRRFGEETAFSEGWALYAESLGGELGVYTDPYQKFGALSFDAWRASRLVVDTGIHWLGWTREQAIQFLIDHAGLSPTEAAEEADRYVAIPAQALAYKIGQREIMDLRERAKAALGDKFDIRQFHEAVLKDGAMPLAILDAKIDRWIGAQKGS